MTAGPKKKRLDQRVVDLGLANSRTKAQAMILAGEILVNGQLATKSGSLISDNATIALKELGPRYVSRGGLKLAGALDHFRIEPRGWNCLDIGASTGGFTDCLLQRGAQHVTCIDVGKGQLDLSLRNHERVTWHESFHVKDLMPAHLEKPVDLAVVDVSFISLKKVIPHVLPCLKSQGLLLALIKPQFEATPKDLVKGVLKNEGRRNEILVSIQTYAQTDLHLKNVEVVDCIIKGPKGNLEAFLKAQTPHPD